MHCNLDDFEDDLKAGKYEIVGHSHPAEDIPVASPDDRITLRKIGQNSSKVISARTGMAVEFGPDRFEFRRR